MSDEKVMSLNTIKGSQFAYPKFEFSGACAVTFNIVSLITIVAVIYFSLLL